MKNFEDINNSYNNEKIVKIRKMPTPDECDSHDAGQTGKLLKLVFHPYFRFKPL